MSRRRMGSGQVGDDAEMDALGDEAIGEFLSLDETVFARAKERIEAFRENTKGKLGVRKGGAKGSR